jgi:NADH-quinone oxidoreductase subunit A
LLRSRVVPFARLASFTRAIGSMANRGLVSAPVPFLIYAAAVFVIVAGMIGLSYGLGQRHKEHQTDEPFESGIVSTGSAHLRVDVKFYLLAMFFVIFDLETMFLFAWAVAAREVGWAGYVEVVIFIAVLVAALLYLWRLGALDWANRRQGRKSKSCDGC